MLPRGSECPGESIEMVSFGIDPQWCGHLFSVYYRHEKAASIASALGGLPGVDTFAISSFSGPPLDVGWIAVAGTFGLEVCRLSSAWAVALESVKATGVIFLLGVGSLMFYKLYHFYCTRRPRPRYISPEHSPSEDGAPFDRQRNLDFSFALADGSEGEDAETLKGLYFGPRSPACDEEEPNRILGNLAPEDGSASPSSSSYGETSGEDDDARDGDVSEDSWMGDRAVGYSNPDSDHVTKSREMWSPPLRLRSYSLHKTHSRPLGHPLNPCCPRGWKRPRHFSSSAILHKSANTTTSETGYWLMGRLKNMILPSFSEKKENNNTKSLPASPAKEVCKKKSRKTPNDCWLDGWSLVGRQAPDGAEVSQNSGLPYVLPVKKLTSAEEPPHVSNDQKLFWEESYDSLGLSDNANGDGAQNIAREGSFDSTCSDFSLDFSLRESADTSTMARMDKLQKEIDQLKTNCLIMDEEFETIKCNRNLPGMSNLISGSIAEDGDNATIVENGESEETVSIKKQKAKACFAGLYSLITIKNSTSSELSDSFPTPYGRQSVGSAESLEWDSPKLTSPIREGSSQRRGKSALNVIDIVPIVDETQVTSEKEISTQPGVLVPSEEEEAMVSLEWDNEDLVEYPEIETCDNVVEGGLDSAANVDVELSYSKELGFNLASQPPLVSEFDSSIETIPSFSGVSIAERLPQLEAHEDDSKMVDSVVSVSLMSSQFSTDAHSKTSNLEVLPIGYWSSEESGYMDWDGRLEGSRNSQRLSPEDQPATGYLGESSYMAVSSCDTSELSTPATETFPSDSLNSVGASLKNIGDRVKLFEYASQEWQGQTLKAQTILKGYEEIPSLLGLDYIRRIRGDNYCAVRATIFQTLTQNIALPSGSDTFQKLAAAHGEGCHWLQDWRFPVSLPYCKNNILHGMRECLEKLDNVAARLEISEDKETTLAGLLNSDDSLDLHIVEAVKLHMLLCAMELHDQNSNGAEVPLFAILMFARDTSETPKDFMNNHLKEVGNSGGLEQVEMFLLGYTLGVTLQVVRPSSYGTNEFICCYPDWNVGAWPKVALIAEDDRHYNVLLK